MSDELSKEVMKSLDTILDSLRGCYIIEATADFTSYDKPLSYYTAGSISRSNEGEVQALVVVAPNEGQPKLGLYYSELMKRHEGSSCLLCTGNKFEHDVPFTLFSDILETSVGAARVTVVLYTEPVDAKARLDNFIAHSEKLNLPVPNTASDSSDGDFDGPAGGPGFSPSWN